MKIPLNELQLGPATRPVDPGRVLQLMKSMSELGLQNPIQVNEKHEVVHGVHRLAAATRLGWKDIECQVINPSDGPKG